MKVINHGWNNEERDRVNKGCDRCRNCGSTESVLKNGSVEISLFNSNIKRRYDDFKCVSCGAKWHGETYDF